MVIAGDSSLKGGVLVPASRCSKIDPRAGDRAARTGCRSSTCVDSGGAYLPLQDEIYALGGHIFQQPVPAERRRASRSSRSCFGHCTAGGAYLPTLCDQSIMVRGTGCVFLAGPPLVKAATGEDVTADELGGADMHTTVSGTADYAVDTEAEGLALARDIVGTVGPAATRRTSTAATPEAPFYDPDGALRDHPGRHQEAVRDARGHRPHRRRQPCSTSSSRATATRWSPAGPSSGACKVGILGNNGVLFTEAANKATQFMQLCDRDGIPLLFLHNVTGFMVGREYERRGITKDGAKMLMVQANVTVPKISLLVPRLAGRRQLRDGRAAPGTRASSSRGRTRARRSWAPSRPSNTLTQVRVASLRRQGHGPDAGGDRADPARGRRRTSSATYRPVLPHLRAARRRAHRPDRHPQHPRHGAVGRR